MKYFSLLTNLVASGALAMTTIAPAAGSTMTPQVDLAHAQKVRAQVQAQVNGSKSAGGKSGVAGAKPGGTKAAELFANPDRAYPPSCLNSPMPLGMWQNDPNAQSVQVNLVGDPYAGGTEAAYIEQDTIHLFRVACTSGLSATLLEIDRPASLEGNTTQYPTFPGVSVSQGNNNLYIRLADDPNTFFSTTYSLDPLINSDVFVLENFYGAAAPFDYNNSFTMLVDTLNSSDPNRYNYLNESTYNSSQYAAASQPLPISGYESGAWYDPNHNGEGIFVEVGDQGTPGTADDRYIVVAWYTYDTLGAPYWLSGAGSFTTGDTSATVQLDSASGGGFAGNFGSSANVDPWGTVTVQFSDCNTMEFSYQSNSGLASPNPTGSGSKTWTRLTQINGLACE